MECRSAMLVKATSIDKETVLSMACGFSHESINEEEMQRTHDIMMVHDKSDAYGSNGQRAPIEYRTLPFPWVQGFIFKRVPVHLVVSCGKNTKNVREWLTYSRPGWPSPELLPDDFL